VARITVVGLGPAGPELVTAATLAAVERIPRRFLRTARHPAAVVVGAASTFDHVYEDADRLDDVYERIVATLVSEAGEHGEVLYAVPGSPLVAERTVELLRERAATGAFEVDVLPALSYLDLAWQALGVDPLAAGVRLVDGHRFAVEAAGERGPLLVAQCDRREVLSEVKLAVEDGPDVVVLQHLGLPAQVVRAVAWSELDRDVEPDHLTTLWIPELAAPVGQELVRFHELVRTLRSECPWDREQTHATLTRHLLEETYEVLDAIDAVDPDAGTGYEDLEEELGDLLFQVVFHAVLGAEEGQFTLADVARGIHDKLVYRHPHVFAAVEVEGAGEVVRNWEHLKAVEKQRSSVMEGIPSALPALAYAAKVQKKAAGVGFDWDDAAGALPKIDEELTELVAALDGPRTDDVAEELGDLLFAVVNVARHAGVDAESALRAATQKFRRRFESVEQLAAGRGLDLHDVGLAGLDRLWEDVKRAERTGHAERTGQTEPSVDAERTVNAERTGHADHDGAA
jgi:tetrapyrrole methylase family protein/MazG family protein